MTTLPITLTSAQVEAACAALTKDGATYEIQPGVDLRVKVWNDPDASLNDYECYGTTSKYAYSYTERDRRTPRPDGFDGSARKIQVDRGLWVWWQPYAEIKSRAAWVRAGGAPDDYEAAFRTHLRDAERLLNEGFYAVTVQLLDTCNLGHQHVVGSDSMCGVDTDDPAYISALVRDLLCEIDGLTINR